MSFNTSSHLESQPTTYRREDDPQYSDDPEFKTFTTDLSDKLFSLTANINHLSRQVALLGTRRETDRVREQVSNIIEEANNGFKEVGEGLKRISQWPDLGPAQKFTQGKLNREFRASLSQFQVLQQEAINKQKAAKAALSGEEQQQGQQQENLMQQQDEARMAPQGEVDFQSSLIIEREQEIRQIEQSVGELNELFRDIAHVVHDQGSQIELISENVQSVRDDTRGADQELRAANRSQRNARSKACCLLLILAIVLIVVIVATVVA